MTEEANKPAESLADKFPNGFPMELADKVPEVVKALQTNAQALHCLAEKLRETADVIEQNEMLFVQAVDALKSVDPSLDELQERLPA